MIRNKSKPKPLRLQKFLADAGVASRRHAEELIEEGRVLVNDVVVDTLPAFVDPRVDRVIVNGTPVRSKSMEYFIVHKPKGVVCTNRDPAGRIRAVDLLPPTKATLNVVGRLDAESTGLLLMTNDGEMAEQITHPRLELPKVYRVEVRGMVSRDIIEQLKKGVHLAEGKAVASEVEIVRRARERSILKITLREGRNRQVRRMLAKFDHAVKTLKRVQIGPINLKGLPVGAARRLSVKELAELREAIREAQSRRTRRGGRRTRPPATTSSNSKVRRGGKPKRPKPGPKPQSRTSEESTSKPRRRLIK